MSQYQQASFSKLLDEWPCPFYAVLLFSLARTQRYYRMI